MERGFSQTMSALRKQRRLNQRKVAADLNISQALLSHYETGAREPGLDFVCRACKYYNVSADYLLGLSDRPDGADRVERLLAGRAELSDDLPHEGVLPRHHSGEDVIERVRDESRLGPERTHVADPPPRRTGTEAQPPSSRIVAEREAARGDPAPRAHAGFEAA